MCEYLAQGGKACPDADRSRRTADEPERSCETGKYENPRAVDVVFYPSRRPKEMTDLAQRLAPLAYIGLGSPADWANGEFLKWFLAQVKFNKSIRDGYVPASCVDKDRCRFPFNSHVRLRAMTAPWIYKAAIENGAVGDVAIEESSNYAEVEEYLRIVDACNKGDKAKCAKVSAARVAAQAAGMDPAVGAMAERCLGGDGEACVKAALVATATSACVTTTGGVGTPLCASVCSVVVDAAWPAIKGVLELTAGGLQDGIAALIPNSWKAKGVWDPETIWDSIWPVYQAAAEQAGRQLDEVWATARASQGLPARAGRNGYDRLMDIVMSPSGPDNPTSSGGGGWRQTGKVAYATADLSRWVKLLGYPHPWDYERSAWPTNCDERCRQGLHYVIVYLFNKYRMDPLQRAMRQATHDIVAEVAEEKASTMPLAPGGIVISDAQAEQLRKKRDSKSGTLLGVVAVGAALAGGAWYAHKEGWLK